MAEPVRVDYLSPSALPSRAANAVHVMMQCQGLARAGARVRLYAKRTITGTAEFRAALRAHYGVDPDAFEVVTCYQSGSRAETLHIAWHALRHMAGSPPADVVISRNLYASFLLAVVRGRRLIFETHQLESGFRRWMQKRVMTRPWVTTVVISTRLDDALRRHHGVGPHRTVVLHDAAPDDIEHVAPSARRAQLLGMVDAARGDWQAVCGYFGHLYAGRGVEIIAGMAAARPRALFLVFGGTDADIAQCRSQWQLPNLAFMGHVPHRVARGIMPRVDVLLMPYQESVAIGARGHDTADWMSPMKMFEYLATGVPIISSDLPALREVLVDGDNSLLAPPAAVERWLDAFDRLLGDASLGLNLGSRARAQCLECYSWTRRAQSLIQAMPPP